MLRVSAYTNGRSAVNEYDALLLQHVLWQRPEEAERVREWLLQRIVKDRGTQQVQYLLSGLYARACRAQGETQDCSLLAAEATKLREVRRGCPASSLRCALTVLCRRSPRNSALSLASTAARYRRCGRTFGSLAQTWSVPRSLLGACCCTAALAARCSDFPHATARCWHRCARASTKCCATW